MFRTVFMTAFYAAVLAWVAGVAGEFGAPKLARYEVRRASYIRQRSAEFNPAPAFPLKAGFDFLHGRSSEATRATLEAVLLFSRGTEEDLRALKPGTAQTDLHPQLCELHTTRRQTLEAWWQTQAGKESWTAQDQGMEELRQAWLALDQRERELCLKAGFTYSLVLLNEDFFYDGRSGFYAPPPWWKATAALGGGLALFFLAWLVLVFEHWPAPLGRGMAWMGARAGWVKIRALDFTRPACLYCCWALFAALFLLTRAPFFLYYQTPLLYPDSGSYFVPLTEWQDGKWPSFSVRTPGYPLFLWLVLKCASSLGAVLYGQHALSLASGLFFIYMVWKLFPRGAPGTTLGLLIFFSTATATHYDSALLSENLYTNGLLGAFAALGLGVRLERGAAGWLALFSALAAGVILVRPAGIFMLVVVATAFLALLVLRAGWRRLCACALPFAALLLLLCTYNQRIFGTFALAPISGQHLASSTWSYWEPAPDYPPELNAMIQRTRRFVTPAERERLEQTWDPEWLSGYQWRQNGHFYTDPGVVSMAQGDPAKAYYWSNRVSKDALNRHPDIFLRIGLGSLWMHFFESIRLQDAFYEVSLPQFYRELFLEKLHTPDKQDRTLAQLAAATPVPSGFDAKGQPQATFLRSVQQAVNSVCGFLKKPCWGWLYFAAFGISGYQTLRARGRHRAALLVFLLAAGVFGAGLIISFTTGTYIRYGYPTEWGLFVCVAMLPALSACKNKATLFVPTPDAAP